ncbi:MAG: hypothetical protein II001_06120 [Bacteroidales bacterium]|nr:hypothetical protein [Bacteroidales bacterium]
MHISKKSSNFASSNKNKELKLAATAIRHTKMKTLNEMTRKELAGKWFDLQVARGMVFNTANRARFIIGCLKGNGAMRPMRKPELISCCLNAQAALEAK